MSCVRSRFAASTVLLVIGTGLPATMAAASGHRLAEERPIRVEVVDADGFSWRDAGIGALAGAGAALAAVGAAVGLRAGLPLPRRQGGRTLRARSTPQRREK